MKIKTNELISAYNSNNYNAIFRYVSSAADELKKNYRVKNYADLQSNMAALKASFLYLRKEEETNESIGYLIGYISGVLKAVEEFTFSEEYKLERFMKESNSTLIKETPHIDEILETLSKTSEIRHGVLATKVGIDKSTLTPIMDKLGKLGLVSFSRIGNRKYYYLNALGKTYLNQNIHKETERNEIKLSSPELLVYAWRVIDKIFENTKADTKKPRKAKPKIVLKSENDYMRKPSSMTSAWDESLWLRNRAELGTKYDYQYQVDPREELCWNDQLKVS